VDAVGQQVEVGEVGQLQPHAHAAAVDARRVGHRELVAGRAP
jgi:hypothetical protein